MNRNGEGCLVATQGRKRCADNRLYDSGRQTAHASEPTLTILLNNRDPEGTASRLSPGRVLVPVIARELPSKVPKSIALRPFRAVALIERVD